MVANKVIVKRDVLHMIVEYRIGTKIGGFNIITINHQWRSEMKSKFSEKRT